jgi:hypothetical protein
METADGKPGAPVTGTGNSEGNSTGNATVTSEARKLQRERAAARREEALALRTSGASYRAIGATLGVSAKQAHLDVVTAMRGDELRSRPETKAERRALLVGQLERVRMAMQAKAVSGDAKAAAVLEKLINQSAQLEGLHAPRLQAVALQANVHQHNTFELGDNEMDRVDVTDRGKRAMLAALTDEERRLYFETIARLRRLPAPASHDDQVALLEKTCTDQELRVLEKAASLRLGLPARDGTPALPLLDGEVVKPSEGN